MDTPSLRLKNARLAAGWDSAAEAAREHKWPVSTYLGHENGSRGYRIEDATKYARAFRVKGGAPFLLFGVSMQRKVSTIPVISFVGAGGKVFDASGPIAEIDAPPNCPDQAFALQIRGDSWHPVYEEGDILICVEETDISSLIHRRVVVDTEDGQRLVKQLARGSSHGLYTLMSANAPPIEDVRITRIARIRFVIPRP